MVVKSSGEHPWSGSIKNPKTINASIFNSSMFALDQKGGKKDQCKKLSGAKQCTGLFFSLIYYNITL